jgi:hypothetical protein
VSCCATPRSRSSAASTSRSSARTDPGKTTLLETLLDNAEARGRKVRLGHSVAVGYFSQQEVELDERHTVLESTQRATNLARPQAQNLLGPLPLLRLGRAGEVGRRALRRRAAPARARARRRLGRELPRPRRADEPSRSRVARGARSRARGFPGTILLVSHDRALVDAVAERTLAVEDRDDQRSYDGCWAEYVQPAR